MLHSVSCPAAISAEKVSAKLFAEDAVELDGMDDCTPVEQGTGECPVARPDLEHAFPLYILKIRYPLYCMRINEEVLVVVRFHRVVKTWYLTSLSWSSSRMRAWIIFSGCGIDLIRADMSAKAGKRFLVALLEDLPHQFLADTREQVEHVEFRA